VFEAPTASLAGRRLTVVYPPASALDALVGADRSLAAAVAIVAVQPTIRVDGQVVAQGSVMLTGDAVPVELDYIVPNRPVDHIANTRSAGETLAIVLNLGRIATERLQSVAQGLDAASGEPDRTERFLALAGLTYFAQVDALDDMSAAFNGIALVREVSGAILQEERNTLFLFGVPVSSVLAGVGIDVDRHVLTPFAKDGDSTKAASFLIRAGANGSAMEHSVWNQLIQQPAVSTTAILSLANAAGVPTFTITSANAAAILPRLTHTAATIAAITQELNAGRTVSIPRDPITYFDWSGTGWISSDPATGAAAFIISGGTSGRISTRAGGSTVFSLECFDAVVEVVAALPIPWVGWFAAVGAALDLYAWHATLRDIDQAGLTGWRQTLAQVFASVGLIGGLLSLVPHPYAVVVGSLLNVIGYVVVWQLTGGGNPFAAPCGFARRSTFGIRQLAYV
jgi:hypothetical protein